MRDKMVNMQTATVRSRVTNKEIADRLGVTHSMISRIRSGNRLPSIDLMLKIQREFDWTLQSQTNNRLLDCYDSEFESIIERDRKIRDDVRAGR